MSPGNNRDELMIAQPLSAGSNPNSNMAGRHREDDHNLVAQPIAADYAKTPDHNGTRGAGNVVLAHTLSSEGADAGEDGTGRGTPLVSVCKHGSMACPECDGVFDVDDDEPAPVSWRGRGLELGEPGVANALRSAGDGHVGDQMGYALVKAAVRRLTPLECERLQGFLDGWTEGLSDSARYRVLGNAVAVPVAEWVARRIARAEGR